LIPEKLNFRRNGNGDAFSSRFQGKGEVSGRDTATNKKGVDGTGAKLSRGGKSLGSSAPSFQRRRQERGGRTTGPEVNRPLPEKRGGGEKIPGSAPTGDYYIRNSATKPGSDGGRGQKKMDAQSSSQNDRAYLTTLRLDVELRCTYVDEKNKNRSTTSHLCS